MSSSYWYELYTGPWIVGGNVAKAKVVHELQRLIANGTASSILDIGIVGPQPLEFVRVQGVGSIRSRRHRDAGR
jgi:hypothetical protein